ncbi:PREDICTED: esterase-like [Populus euphratica]|uniref:Esterase-like n=1 Tax=Populus euphratica TaxID=75702 RepID=A0AAJ6U3R7_POPEU|nr:PREDICTED: esterase-like [Populus euphratica]
MRGGVSMPDVHGTGGCRVALDVGPDRWLFGNAEGGIFAKLMPHEEYFEKGLYTFYIGQNDLVAGALSVSVEEVNASVPAMVNAFSTMFSAYTTGELDRSGLHSTGPIGCLGYILVGFPAAGKDDAGRAKPYSEGDDKFDVISLQIVGFELPLVICCCYGNKHAFGSTAVCGAIFTVKGTHRKQ